MFLYFSCIFWGVPSTFLFYSAMMKTALPCFDEICKSYYEFAKDWQKTGWTTCCILFLNHLFYLFFTWLTQNLFESTKGIKSSFFTKLFLPDGKTFHLICSKHKNTLDKVINLITDSIIHLGCKLIDNIYTVNK